MEACALPLVALDLDPSVFIFPVHISLPYQYPSTAEAVWDLPLLPPQILVWKSEVKPLLWFFQVSFLYFIAQNNPKSHI